MGKHLNKVVNVTIYYPQGIPTFFDFICGRVTDIHVRVDTFDVDEQIIGDYFNDVTFKRNFQKWINQLWIDKDKTITDMRQQ